MILQNLANIMNKLFEMKLIRQLASASVVAFAAYALSSGACYAQQATPSPSPMVSKAADGKETKEAKKVVEQAQFHSGLDSKCR